MTTRQQLAPFRVGDRVTFDLGRRKLIGFIVEDRGPLGIGRRRLYQVEVPIEPDEPMQMELSEDELTAAPAETEPARSMPKEDVVAYLTHGGLISILRSNISGGKNQARAWLCPDTLGNVTHTFRPHRGVIGGELVPFWAVHDDKVFIPKRDAVVAFVESFGLSRQEAEKVVSEVGTAP